MVPFALTTASGESGLQKGHLWWKLSVLYLPDSPLLPDLSPADPALSLPREMPIPNSHVAFRLRAWSRVCVPSQEP